MTVGAYARISTDEKRQSAESQLREIRAFVAHRGWQIVDEYTENMSGAVGIHNRPELARLLADAHRGRFQAVVVFALDRLTRRGIKDAFGYVERLSNANVEFYSVTEPQFTTAGPAGDLMIAIAAWMAKNERDHQQKRIMAGLNRARAKGVTLGRKPRIFDAQKAYDLRAGGTSWRTVAKVLGISTGVLRRRLATFIPTTGVYTPKLQVVTGQSRPDSLEEWESRAKEA